MTTPTVLGRQTLRLALGWLLAATVIALSGSAAHAADLRDQFKAACKVNQSRFADVKIINSIARNVCFDNGTYTLHPATNLADLEIVLLAFLSELPPGWYGAEHQGCLAVKPVCEGYGEPSCAKWGSPPCTRTAQGPCLKRDVKGHCTKHGDDRCAAWGHPSCEAWGPRPCTQWGSTCVHTGTVVDEGAMFATIGAGADLILPYTPPPVPSCLIKQNGRLGYRFVDYVWRAPSPDGFKKAVQQIAADYKNRKLDFRQLLTRLQAAFYGITVTVNSSTSMSSNDMAMYAAEWAGDVVIELIKDMLKQESEELEAAAAAG